MALVKISELADGAPIDGTEDLEMVKGGVSKRCSTQDIAELAIRTIKISLSSAEILALNSSPKTLVTAQGVNTFVRPLQVLFKLTYTGVSYATNTNLLIKVGSFSFLTNTTVLPATSNFLNNSPMVGASLGGGADMFNAPCLLSVSAGNPTAGTGTLEIYLTYQVIPIT